MSDKLIGKTLAGRFVLEEQLGAGATGAVYRAQQTSVDRVVAVKTLHAFLQEQEDFKARFEIEAKAIARLNHPNCITLYDFGYDEEFDVFYMAVEYIGGRVLADVVQDGLTDEELYSIFYQVAEALDHAHREGILHRDLKPENIMVEAHPESARHVVKVLDFGLARLYESSAAADDDSPRRYKRITEVGQVYGTPAYMSPEQCRGNENLTPATDLYALGTMMFELFEGRLPFFSKSTAELIMMQMSDDPPRMENLNVSAEVRDLVFRTMAKDPAARPQSAREVLAVLMPHVRLDASQELRIPTSAELMRPTAEELASLRLNDEIALESPPSTQLTSDEVRALNKAVVPRSLIVGLLFLMIGAGAILLQTQSADEETQEVRRDVVESEPPPAMELAAPSVEATPEIVAEVVADPAPSPKRTPAEKPRRASEDQPTEVLDSGEADAVPTRAKTLKLTY